MSKKTDLHLLEYYREKKAKAIKEIRTLLEEWAKQTAGIWTTPCIAIIPHYTEHEHKGYEAFFVLRESRNAIFWALWNDEVGYSEHIPVDIEKLDDNLFWEIVDKLPSVINDYVEECRELCTKTKGVRQ